MTVKKPADLIQGELIDLTPILDRLVAQGEYVSATDLFVASAEYAIVEHTEPRDNGTVLVHTVQATVSVPEDMDIAVEGVSDL